MKENNDNYPLLSNIDESNYSERFLLTTFDSVSDLGTVILVVLWPLFMRFSGKGPTERAM